MMSKHWFKKVAKYEGTENKLVDKMWEIKAIFEGAETEGKIAVLYLGWNSEHMYDVDVEWFREHYKRVYDIAEARNKFVEVLKKKISDKEKKALIELEQCMTLDLQYDCSNRYWFLQDLTYFHSKIQQDNGLGNVHYMCIFRIN
ncbi:hypothetical protein GCK72_004705 [Caenorhabditis remanei]|uniref:Uncharacterized protein n=1 Tax=Caenorhabditis remanei TaxID=31234 RepID=A0A6A5HBX6_CAERE|nr:hypothetical protein GCK72_004705 [Caenorhabditis remanei]KAF1764755.1 hypothetical protein GCK72_004705 [Caenorhabditis remanei]